MRVYYMDIETIIIEFPWSNQLLVVEKKFLNDWSGLLSKW